MLSLVDIPRKERDEMAYFNFRSGNFLGDDDYGYH